jgi:hypothetical protein
MVVSAISIAVAAPSGSDDGCPSPRQVTDALSARLPWAMQPPAQVGPPATLRLALTAAPGGGVRLQLSDTGGETVLVRVLPPSARGKSDCPALAETVALIVDRYLHDVGFEAPPLPPPALPPPAVTRAPPAPPAAPPAPDAPRWRIGVGVEGQYGDTRSLDGSLALSLAYERPVGGTRGGLRLSAGMARAVEAHWQSNQNNQSNDATLQRIPLRLGAYLAFAAGPGQLEPGVSLGLDLLDAPVTSTPPPREGGGLHAAPSTGAEVAYALPLGKSVFLRGLARGGVAMPYVFRTSAGDEVWSTPRTYLELGVESGVSFP